MVFPQVTGASETDWMMDIISADILSDRLRYCFQIEFASHPFDTVNCQRACLVDLTCFAGTLGRSCLWAETFGFFGKFLSSKLA